MGKKGRRMAGGCDGQRRKRGRGCDSQQDVRCVEAGTQRGCIKSGTSTGRFLVISGARIRVDDTDRFIEAVCVRNRMPIPHPLRQQQAQHQNHAQKRGGKMHFAADQCG